MNDLKNKRKPEMKMDNLQFFLDNLALFLPLVLLEFLLMIAAAIHVVKHPHYRFGTKAMWLLIVLLVQIIGPVCYFVFGRGEVE